MEVGGVVSRGGEREAHNRLDVEGRKKKEEKSNSDKSR